MSNVDQRETVLQNRSRMMRSVCNFKTRGERRATKGMIRRRVQRCEGN